MQNLSRGEGRSGSTTSEYLHGTQPDEQRRLEQLNHWINERCLSAVRLGSGQRVIDFGSGLGQLTARMADAVGPTGYVLGIERSQDQLDAANRAFSATGRSHPEFRLGTVEDPPLAAHEWASFDVAHARFVLEHVAHPDAVVRNMVRSVRPGGRVVLADDDHPLLRLWPEAPGFETLWTAYQRAFERNGNDPIVGRRLVQLLHDAGARPVRNDWLFFGSCASSPDWGMAIDNLVGVVKSAEDRMLQLALIDRASSDAAFAALSLWRTRPDAALWFAIPWAEGLRRASGE